MVLHEIDVPSRAGAVTTAKARRPFEPLIARLGPRRVWHVNSTSAGGGVAEMLPSLIGSARGLGIDMRWLVLDGTPEFFAVTKRIHHALHGSAGDGRGLDADARATYESVLAPVASALVQRLQPGDAVMLHDPQTAGLAPAVVAAGHPVVWRCHVGDDAPSTEVARAWAFLHDYLADVDAYVFSRAAFVPPVLDASRAVIVTPSIDPESPKNEALGDDDVRAILTRAGLVAGRASASPLTIAAPDGARRVVRRRARVIGSGGLPPWDVPLVVQISRWDPLKDFAGVMRGFAMLAAGHRLPVGTRLMLAGPSVDGVADDPEAVATLDAVAREWQDLAPTIRRRISLVQLPTDDIVENATIVNALQRHATVVVQKSLREGFGLTVTEAMWKARPVLAAAVGGIQDQVDDGANGILLPDPRDLNAYAGALEALLADPDGAAHIGVAARDTVRRRFLTLPHLRREMELFARIAQAPQRDATAKPRKRRSRRASA